MQKKPINKEIYFIISTNLILKAKDQNKYWIKKIKSLKM